jgi:hypothetical protein
MYPSFFTTLTGNGSVTAALGSNPTRVFPHGEAPQGVARPYVTHQLVAGTPENYLGDTADADACRVQFNCYADTSAAAVNAASVIRAALEGIGYVVSLNGTGKDAETNRYSYSFDMEFVSSR